MLLLVLPATGCILRSHRVEPMQVSHAKLQSATVTDLVNRINNEAHEIRTLNATVDIATSVGGGKSGKVTEYQEIRGYILVRQPGMLRMIGLTPVVRTRAFDMVSKGADFELYVPPQRKLYVGKNDVAVNGSTGLTAMRPQIIYNALLLIDIDPQSDIAVVESGQEVVTDPKSHQNFQQPDYRLDIIHHGAKGWFLERKIYFNRATLQPRHQRVFNDKGHAVSDMQYRDWKQYQGLWFPAVIEIWRPIEEYRITLGVVKLELNQNLTDQQFALTTPADTKVMQD